MQNISINNAAGTCKTVEQVEKLARAVDHTVTVGTITINERKGNEGQVYYRQPDPSRGSVNRLGIPCRGFSYYEKNLPTMVEIAHKAGKSLSVSIAELEKGDLETLTRLCVEANVAVIEVNVGCPHIIAGDGRPKPIPSYDPVLLVRQLHLVRSLSRGQFLRVKLSPYFDTVLIERVAQVLAELPYYTPVFCNTLPNIRMLRDDNRKEAVTGGIGGHAGSDLFRAIVCGNIMQFRRYLPDRAFIGAGGIRNGAHLLDYLDLGVPQVQVGTAYYDTENPRIFQDIREEYANLATEPAEAATL